MTERRNSVTLLALAVVLAGTLSACDGVNSESCVGSRKGDVTLRMSEQGEDPSKGLPGGGRAYVAYVDFEADPARVYINVVGSTTSQKESNYDLVVGDSFRAEGASYTVNGFCTDKAYLAASDIPIERSAG